MVYIYCPKCAYQPQPNDLWRCGPPGCGHVWNTFQTHGQCPNCYKQWRLTQCRGCKEWSPHEDWYHATPPVETEKREETLIAG